MFTERVQSGRSCSPHAVILYGSDFLDRFITSRPMLDLLTVGQKFTRLACRATTAAIDRYLLPAPDLSTKHAAAVDRLDRQTDGLTDGRTLYRFVTLTACYAELDGARAIRFGFVA